MHPCTCRTITKKWSVAGNGDGANRDDVWCVKGDGIEYKELEFKKQCRHTCGCTLLKFTRRNILQKQMFTILDYHKAAMCTIALLFN